MKNINSLRILNYNREKALLYAHRWAFGRNPVYYNFDNLGGDCTNFCSQVIFAGSGIMNYTPVYGWYYLSLSKRTPSWTGVDFLYNFLTANRAAGPFSSQVDIKDIRPGDLIQLSFDSAIRFNHSLIVVNTGIVSSIDNIQICTHTYNRDYYNLSNYNWKYIRFIHIEGVRA